ncbi:DUF7662 domain-containing protein [Ureibacillus aquaedulcis]|uniref:DUF7662 domain-containing protein n=1 Tax=Ureibacillus aquaedulcis TaxID=3058421 RepID=A0ABT8GNT0_9BACL|nr:hypothetical protein [Ureibacillus sp. BA0131]MDN4493072.1 hypothetical protein [Ureibacillus sp. BA0131]
MRGEKYLPLHQYLKSNASEYITLPFEKIEMILGFKLPNSAYKYSPWWSNNIGTHTQAHSRIDAGYKTQSVQLGNQVVFRRDIII